MDSTSRELLLVAAKKLFARKGLSGTSIRDIAREANMNSSQISYYFKGKEGLYSACIESIAQERVRIAEQVLVPAETLEEFRVRLKLFVENLFQHFLEDRDQGLLIIREHDRLHSPAEKTFRTYFSRHYSLLVDFFTRGHERGFSPKVGDAITTTSLFFGAVVGELRFDHIRHSLYGRSLKSGPERTKVVDAIVNLFSYASNPVSV